MRTGRRADGKMIRVVLVHVSGLAHRVSRLQCRPVVLHPLPCGNMQQGRTQSLPVRPGPRLRWAVHAQAWGASGSVRSRPGAPPLRVHPAPLGDAACRRLRMLKRQTDSRRSHAPTGGLSCDPTPERSFHQKPTRLQGAPVSQRRYRAAQDQRPWQASGLAVPGRRQATGPAKATQGGPPPRPFAPKSAVFEVRPLNRRLLV